MLLDHVSVLDLEPRLGTLQGDDLVRAAEDLADAATLVEATFHLTDPPSDLAVMLVKRVAVRAFRNPNGIVQESLGSRSVTYAEHDRRPGVYLTAEELSWLPRGRSAVFSLPLTTPADRL